MIECFGGVAAGHASASAAQSAEHQRPSGQQFETLSAGAARTPGGHRDEEGHSLDANAVAARAGQLAQLATGVRSSDLLRAVEYGWSIS